MPIEQEPIKIVIPVEEEETVMVAERGRGALATTTSGLGKASRRAAGTAQRAWQSDQRRQAQASVAAGTRRGVKAGRRGLGYGLNWLSVRLARLAKKLTSEK